MKTLRYPFSLYLVLLTNCTLLWAADLYVGPQGNDRNPGTVQYPLQTLEAARDRVRAADRTAPVTIWLQDGRYELKETFEVLVEDTGTSQAPIAYKAVNPGQVTICGSVKLPNKWQGSKDTRIPGEARGKVQQIDLKALGINDYGKMLGRGFSQPVWPLEMELFVNNQRMQLARWPNVTEDEHFGKAQYGKVTEVGTRSRFGETDNRPGKIIFKNERIKRWKNAQDPWLHGQWAWDWADRRMRLLDVNVETGELTVEHSHYGFKQRKWFYAINLLKELDSPGEYYIDRELGVLYFWPPVDLEDAHVTVSILSEPLVAIENASYISFEGIVFEECRSLGIGIVGGSHNRIQNCTLRNLGTAAINIGEGERGREIYNIGYGGGMDGLYANTGWNRNGGTDNGVIGCHIHDIGAYGIMLGGGDRKTLTPAGNFVEGCHIHHTARIYEQMFSNINIDGVGNRVSFCLLTHNPHSVIMYWGNDHLIQYNEIAHCVYDSSDAGAIYTGRDPSQAGTVIRWNYFHHIKGHENFEGVFFDDGAAEQRVYGNVFHDIQSRGAVKYHGGQNNEVTNNIIIDCSKPVDYQLWDQGRWMRFLQSDLLQTRLLEAVNVLEEPYASAYPGLAKIFDVPYSKQSHIEERNLVTHAQDPLFENGKAGDFRIRDWEALRQRVPGFQVIPIERIGLPGQKRPPLAPVFESVNKRLFPGQLLTIRPGKSDDGREDLTIVYTLDGSEPTVNSLVYTQPLVLERAGTIKARIFAGDLKSVISERVCYPPVGTIYLDELGPIEVVAHNGLKVNHNYGFSNFVILGDTLYKHSIMACPARPDGIAYARYDISIFPPQRVFKAVVGIDKSVGKQGSASFQVRVLKDGNWQTTFKSPVLRGGDQSVEISVPVNGAEQIELFANDGGDGIGADHAAWGNACIVVVR